MSKVVKKNTATKTAAVDTAEIEAKEPVTEIAENENIPVDNSADEDEVKRLPPYALNYNRIVALFGKDPELNISELDNENRTVTISSKNYHKLSALGKVLRSPMEQLNIKLVNEDFESEYVRTLEDVFAGNPHFDNIRVAIDAMTLDEVPIVTFKDETIQYPADNRFVPHGYETTLAETLVKQLFKGEYRRNTYVTKEKGEECPDVIKIGSSICAVGNSPAIWTRVDNGIN